MLYLVKKKTGVLEDWNSDKIEKAIQKSALRTERALTEDEIAEVVSLVESSCLTRSDNVIPIEAVHVSVENALKSHS